MGRTGDTPGDTPAVTPRDRAAPNPAHGPGRRGIAWPILRVGAVLTAGAVLAVAWAAWASADRVLEGTRTVSAFDLPGGLSAVRPPDTPGTTVLIVGSDDRSGLSRTERARLHAGRQDYGRRTDVLLLAHLAADGSHASVISLPRDSLVTLPAWPQDGGTRPAGPAKLNEAYAYGGAPMTVVAVEGATGLRIDHYIEIDFAGFLDLVGAVDPITICTDTAVRDKAAGLNLPAGTSELDPVTALALMRARSLDPSADIGRMERQQQFLAALASRLIEAATSSPAAAGVLVDTVTRSLTTDRQFTRGGALALLDRARRLDPSAITLRTVPIAEASHRVAGVGATVRWHDRRAGRLFQRIAADTPLTRAPARTSDYIERVPRAEVIVTVHNAAGVSGLAARSAEALRLAGFTVVGVPMNWYAGTRDRSEVRYAPGLRDDAETVAAVFPQARPVLDRANAGQLEIVIGRDWAEQDLAAVSPDPVTGSAADQPAVPAGTGRSRSCEVALLR